MDSFQILIDLEGKIFIPFLIKNTLVLFVYLLVDPIFRFMPLKVSEQNYIFINNSKKKDDRKILRKQLYLV